MKNWNIHAIESMTESEAVAMAEETMDIKGYTVYFIDFPGYFGYSCCVFKNGHHISYANDYELHHADRCHKWLRKWYVDSLNNKLFTDAEISAPIASYDDYQRRKYFLTNYYHMQADYVSFFHYSANDEEEKAYRAKRAKMPIFNSISFAYMADRDFVDHHIELYNALEARKTETNNNYEYQVQAFMTEMYDHEYNINWQADFDVLSAFGALVYHDERNNSKSELQDYFEQLNFSDLQIRAYLDARSRYSKAANY